MKCCVHCFSDKEIIGFIYSNSTETGDCDGCAAKGVELIDARELEELFQPVISLFKPIAVLGITVLEEQCLHQKIQDSWKVFNLPDESTTKKLLTAIVANSISANDQLLNEPVEIELLFKPGAVADVHEKNGKVLQKKLNLKTAFFERNH